MHLIRQCGVRPVTILNVGIIIMKSDVLVNLESFETRGKEAWYLLQALAPEAGNLVGGGGPLDTAAKSM
jgi:hypothetical protein